MRNRQRPRPARDALLSVTARGRHSHLSAVAASMSDADLETLAEWRRAVERLAQGNYPTVGAIVQLLKRRGERAPAARSEIE
jgi:hypothetical protein